MTKPPLRLAGAPVADPTVEAEAVTLVQMAVTHNLTLPSVRMRIAACRAHARRYTIEARTWELVAERLEVQAHGAAAATGPRLHAVPVMVEQSAPARQPHTQGVTFVEFAPEDDE